MAGGDIQVSWEKGQKVKIILKRYDYICKSVSACDSKKGKFCTKREFCEYKERM